MATVFYVSLGFLVDSFCLHSYFRYRWGKQAEKHRSALAKAARMQAEKHRSALPCRLRSTAARWPQVRFRRQALSRIPPPVR